MKLYTFTKNFYILVLILFTTIFLNFRPKPKLKVITFSQGNLTPYLNFEIKKGDKKKLQTSDNRINLGKDYFFSYNDDWYKVTQFSFWRRKFLDLSFVAKKLNISNEMIITPTINKDNNFASGILNNEYITYACLKNPDEFYYKISHNYVPETDDLIYWKDVFLKSIKDVIYSFKPMNYQCLFVITSNRNFFKDSEKNKRDYILNHFIYSSEKE